MTVSYQILKKKRLVTITTSGEINLDETIQSLEQMYADPEYMMDYDLLWDDIERTAVFICDDMHKMLQHFRHYSGDKNPKRAIVISRTDNYGMTRVFNTLATTSTKTQIALFADKTEACKWLEH
jgi:hypothetical protein